MDEREEHRLSQKKATKEFLQLLEETPALTADMRFREALRHIEQDPRFAALEQPRDREVRLPQPWDGA
jgi:hypothetical protein